MTLTVAGAFYDALSNIYAYNPERNPAFAQGFTVSAATTVSALAIHIPSTTTGIANVPLAAGTKIGLASDFTSQTTMYQVPWLTDTGGQPAFATLLADIDIPAGNNGGWTAPIELPGPVLLAPGSYRIVILAPDGLTTNYVDAWTAAQAPAATVSGTVSAVNGFFHDYPQGGVLSSANIPFRLYEPAAAPTPTPTPTPPAATPTSGIDPLYPNVGGVGGFVRWRPRMVRQSVLQDIKQTLSVSGWLGIPTVGLLTQAITFEDAFPEEDLVQGRTVGLNTFVLDNGRPGVLEEYEMGGLYSRPYAFSMAFFAETDAVALSLYSDLADRYNGLTVSPWISLYNYAAATPTLVTRMEVESFEYGRAPREVAGQERHLFLAELQVLDFVDQTGTRTQ